MTSLDRVKLAKVLELLRSPHDGEKLAAVARANEMLERAGLTWTEFCSAGGGLTFYVGFDTSPFADASVYAGYGAGFSRMRRREAEQAARAWAAERAARAKESHGPDGSSDWKPTRIEILRFANKVAVHPQFHGLPKSAQMLVFRLVLMPNATVSADELKYLIEIAKLLKMEVPA